MPELVPSLRARSLGWITKPTLIVMSLPLSRVFALVLYLLAAYFLFR